MSSTEYDRSISGAWKIFGFPHARFLTGKLVTISIYLGLAHWLVGGRGASRYPRLLSGPRRVTSYASSEKIDPRGSDGNTLSP